MTEPLAPYDAVLLVSYGGPDGPDDVLPFLRNATRGRGIPDARLAEVAEHYALFGGRSPLNERNADLADALGAALAARGCSVPVAVGNRNWHPFLADAVRALAARGARRVVCVLTAAYASYSGCRQYRENLADALAETGGTVALAKIGPYAESAGFVAANADALVAACAEVGGRPRVLFATHSLPLAQDAAAGPGPAEGTYVAQHRRVAARVVEAARERLGFAPEWDVSFCSRSGPPQVPWLEPDVDDRLRALAAEGASAVVVAPIGFIHDHLEVVYDLDTRAAATASEVGLRFARAATAGVHPAFVGALADALVQRAAVERGEAAEPADARYRCAPGCCLSGRPGPGAPAALDAD